MVAVTVVVAMVMMVVPLPVPPAMETGVVVVVGFYEGGRNFTGAFDPSVADRRRG